MVVPDELAPPAWSSRGSPPPSPLGDAPDLRAHRLDVLNSDVGGDLLRRPLSVWIHLVEHHHAGVVGSPRCWSRGPSGSHWLQQAGELRRKPALGGAVEDRDLPTQAAPLWSSGWSPHRRAAGGAEADPRQKSSAPDRDHHDRGRLPGASSAYRRFRSRPGRAARGPGGAARSASGAPPPAGRAPPGGRPRGRWAPRPLPPPRLPRAPGGDGRGGLLGRGVGGHLVPPSTKNLAFSRRRRTSRACAKYRRTSTAVPERGQAAKSLLPGVDPWTARDVKRGRVRSASGVDPERRLAALADQTDGLLGESPRRPRGPTAPTW